jgi:hypothetical protein
MFDCVEDWVKCFRKTAKKHKKLRSVKPVSLFTV